MKAVTRILAIAALAMSVVACSKVDPGHIGVRVSNFGDRGVTNEIVQPGKWVWNGPGYQLFEFPTFKQNYVYKDAETLTFGTQEGLSVGADVGISYRILPAMAPKLFQDYRKGVDEITSVDMRNTVQNALVNAAGKRPVETVYGVGKAELIAEVKTVVQKQMAISGIQVDEIYWGGNLRLPDSVNNAIKAKINATQMTAQRQNEVAQAKAEAEKAVATAQGVADSTLLRARAEAESIQIKGDAIKNNPSLIELEKVNAQKILYSRWQGGGQPVPSHVFGNTPVMLQMPGQ